jgi:hypothetical protein
MGAVTHSADRHPGRAAHLGRVRAAAAGGEPGVRHRRAGRAHLRADDQRYAAVAGLRPRLLLPVGVLSPSLSSHWVGLVTPVPGALARPLVESLRHDAVAAEQDIAGYVPDPPGGLTGFDDSVRLALQKIRKADIATRWSSASLPGAPSDPLPTDPDWAGGSLYHDLREQQVTAPGEAVWRIIKGIGGEHGWYSWPLAWKVRGWLDRAAGGAGLRRGRRDPDRLRAGDALDFWRVEAIEPGHLLRLRGDEPARPGLAGTVSRRACRAHGLPAARAVPSTRPGRPPLLAHIAATARHRLRRHGPQHHPGSRARPGAPIRPASAPAGERFLPR